MSHNDNVPQRSARNHAPAIIAIVIALIVAALAFMWFGPNDERGETDAVAPVPEAVTDGTAGTTTVSPPGTPATAPTNAPDGAATSVTTTPEGATVTTTAPATETPPATSTGPTN